MGGILLILALRLLVLNRRLAGLNPLLWLICSIPDGVTAGCYGNRQAHVLNDLMENLLKIILHIHTCNLCHIPEAVTRIILFPKVLHHVHTVLLVEVDKA